MDLLAGCPGNWAEILAGRLLPLEGVELFTERGGRWYRLGEHLPALSVPFHDGEEGVGLDRVLIPGKLSAQRPSECLPESLRVAVVPEERHDVRPGDRHEVFARGALSIWAEQATSLQISNDCKEPGGKPRGIGARGRSVGARHAGKVAPSYGRACGTGGPSCWFRWDFAPDPELPAQAIRAVVGAGDGDLVVLDDAGIELIPLDAFQPLSRGRHPAGSARAHPRVGRTGGRVT